MLGFFEKWYVLFKLMQIARQNKKRRKFEEKYKYGDVFHFYGENLDDTYLVRCELKENGLFKKSKGKNLEWAADNKMFPDEFGIQQYVCEEETQLSVYGMVYRKTPFKNIYIETPYWTTKGSEYYGYKENR